MTTCSLYDAAEEVAEEMLRPDTLRIYERASELAELCAPGYGDPSPSHEFHRSLTALALLTSHLAILVSIPQLTGHRGSVLESISVQGHVEHSVVTLGRSRLGGEPYVLVLRTMAPLVDLAAMVVGRRPAHMLPDILFDGLPGSASGLKPELGLPGVLRCLDEWFPDLLIDDAYAARAERARQRIRSLRATVRSFQLCRHIMNT